MHSVGIDKFLESSLYKIMINKHGDILGMTNALKGLTNQDNEPKHISDLFDVDLLEKIELHLMDRDFQRGHLQNGLTGKLLLKKKTFASCYIIYQPQSERAIITIKTSEQKREFFKVYENAFQEADIPMGIFNEWGLFVSVNDRFKKLDFYRDTGLLHLKTFLKALHHENEFCIATHIRNTRKNGLTQSRWAYHGKNQTCYYNITTQLDQATDLFVIKLIDVTEEENLLRLLAHSDQLSTTGEIAASVAHEIRNPMTTLQGFLQLLEHEVEGNAQKYVMIIQEEVKRMNDILNEMLSLSKPSTDVMSLFSLDSLVDEVLLLLRPKALLDQINLVYENFIEEPLLIKGNPNRIKQIFVNLIKNSMEAMDSSGTLTVNLYEGDAKTVDVMIADTGTGMSPEILETIFLPFVTLKEGGTGLGLPFVKKTVNEYGGNISVKSEVGKGTEFLISFPRAILASESEIEDKIVSFS
ncbi:MULTISPECIES: ATP-binding protein [unclassified Sporosarcina]|uniref:ATP-binding protein n=1 Tax=unclassified Sporosarcina TaxID=2647733 RepID=UPI00203EAB4F|nr:MULTISPECIES: ATP-binding protein [unclassified Sporosarcina]